MTQASLTERRYSEDTYARDLRAVARSLWLGLVSPDQFSAAMVSTLEVGLRAAWAEGAAECGVRPEEFTAEEQARLNAEVYGQLQYVPGLGQFIEANSKANGGKWGDVAARMELWANRYRAARDTAAALACADKKKVFVLGSTVEHCRSCLGLTGRVYRYSVWLNNDAVPPSHRFECGGFRCQCGLEDTDERMTPGPFPRGLLV